MSFRTDWNTKEKQDKINEKKRQKDYWDIFQGLQEYSREAATATSTSHKNTTQATSSTNKNTAQFKSPAPQLNKTVHSATQTAKTTSVTNNTTPNDPATPAVHATLRRIERVILSHFQGKTILRFQEIQVLDTELDRLEVGPSGTKSRELRKILINSLETIETQMQQ